LQNVIDQYIANQKIHTASIFLKKFNTNESLLINNTEKYAPGSLLKISIMIAILKVSEKDNELLNKKITFIQTSKNNKVQTIVSNSIKIGQSYSIKGTSTDSKTYCKGCSSFSHTIPVLKIA
jgi:beta-lactamase class A